MKTVVGGSDVDLFRAVVARRLGLTLEGFTSSALAELLSQRVAAHGGSCEAYLQRLASGPSRDEVSALARELTVAETYFFRNREQFRALADVVLPERMRARAVERQLRFLSVGCASGDEAYTLAIVIHDIAHEPEWRVSIVGADVNAEMLRRAEGGRYSPWALRAVPDELRRRWFRPDGQALVLDENIRRSVSFVERNLMDADEDLWRADTYDAIFCRNVIMYLTRDSGDVLVDRMVRALAPGGFLFLGHADSLRGRRGDLRLRHTHDTFYYQRGTGPPDGLRQPPPSEPSTTGWPAGPPPTISEDWMGTIGAATGRIRKLAEGHDLAARPTRARPVTPVHSDWERAVDLVRHESFSAALEVVESFPPGARNRPEALLLHAVVLIQCGRMDRAEDVCGRLLELDALNAAAHYLLGLCRENSGDAEAAVRQNQRAAHLDPTFALPRLRLGILARRGGDPESARRELGHALALLSREDAHRLELFAGGFSRFALIELCRFELAACGIAS